MPRRPSSKWILIAALFGAGCGTETLSAPPQRQKVHAATQRQMPYDAEMLRADLTRALQSRPAGTLSKQPLGNPKNIALWTPTRLQQLLAGLKTAQARFFPQIGLQDFARLIVAEGSQESTGDWNLGVRKIDLSDHASQGFLQVTPASVVLDYITYGLPIRDAEGKVVLDPKTVQNLSLADPGLNVLIWAWYTRNSVALGVSLNEWAHRVAWNIPIGKVRRDVGNAQFTWLAGPHNDRHVDGKNYVHYYSRIADYFVAAGFGSQERFDVLLATTFDAAPIAVHEL